MKLDLHVFLQWNWITSHVIYGSILGSHRISMSSPIWTWPYETTYPLYWLYSPDINIFALQFLSMASHAGTLNSQSLYPYHANTKRKMHTLSLSLSSSVRVRASWDTEQSLRLPYNPNAPRKLKKNTETLTQPSSLKEASPSVNSNSSTKWTEQYVNDLLKRNSPAPSKGICFSRNYVELLNFPSFFSLCSG